MTLHVKCHFRENKKMTASSWNFKLNKKNWNQNLYFLLIINCSKRYIRIAEWCCRVSMLSTGGLLFSDCIYNKKYRAERNMEHHIVKICGNDEWKLEIMIVLSFMFVCNWRSEGVILIVRILGYKFEEKFYIVQKFNE